MSETTRIFGTDGVRGRAGEGWLTPDAVSVLGRTLAQVLDPPTAENRTARPRALLGHDGRRSGPELEHALARGLVAGGFDVVSAGLTTTPGLAFLVRASDFDLGVMVSASHNPAEDNGIKVFSKGGEKLSDEEEQRIEKLLRSGEIEPVREGAAALLDPKLEARYLEHLLTSAGNGLGLEGLELVLDCANGGASRVAPSVFGRLGARVVTVAAEPDGDNINLECGATLPKLMQEQVTSHGAAVGIALDGDGDRCVLSDENGRLVHGDGIMTLITRHDAELGRLTDRRIVATVMSNRGLHRALREVGVEVVTVGVGDRRVVEGLRRESLRLGGEQSGHIVFGPDNFHIGDGIYTALRVLRVMRESGRPLSELAAAYQPFPQVLLNVPVRTKPPLQGLQAVMDEVLRCEQDLGQDGRVLLRYSGTEDLARVMVEGPDADDIRRQAQRIAKLITADIGA